MSSWRNYDYLHSTNNYGKVKKINYGNTMQNVGVSSGTPSSMPKVGPIESLPKVTVSQRAGLAAEKASRVFAQNSPDMYNSTPKQIGPKQWAGPTNTAALRVAPGSSNVKKAAAANNRANAAYLKYAAEAYVPESLPKVGDTPIGPQQLPSVGNLTPYTPNTKPVKELSFKEKFMQKGLNPSETWANSSMELPAVPTAAKQGGGLGNRGYNAVSSIGDNMIGADKSLKATANQSFENEKAYRKALMSYNETIDALMLARDRYPSTSDEYKKYSTAIEGIYAAADSLRDKAADMTDSNEFMASAEQLRKEATKGLSGLPLQLAEAAISVGDNLTTMGMTGFNPTATLIMMGAKAAGQRANELSNQGVSAGDAFSRGVLSGVIEGVTEKIGLDNLLDIVNSNNVKVLSSILKQMVAEGGEEGLSSIMNYAADRMSGDNKDFDWDDFSQSIIQGALSGLIFGAGGTVTNKVMPMVSGYSDMEHLNMARELEAKRAKKPLESMVMPSVGKYSSNTVNTGVNIGNMSAEEYLDKYNNELVRKSEQSEYMKQVYDVMMGKMPSHKAVEVMKTPDILKQYGAKDLTITIDQKNIRKIAYPQDYLGLEQGHNLGFYFIEQLPEQLSKPVAILKSKTQKNSFVIVTEMVDTFNKPVLVAVHLDKNGKIGLSNEIASAYGKDNYSSFISDNRKKGNIVYEDINRGLDSLPVNGLQLSKMEATTNPKLSINNNQVNVNNKIPAMSDIRNIQNQSDMVMPKVGDTAPSVWDAKPIAGSDEINRTNEASVINQLRSNISDLSKMESVSVIKGNEFQKGDKTLIEAVKEFFDGIGGKVQRDGFGEVLLTKKGIKSSIGHGIGRAKSAAFKAVPDVIKNGKQIGYQRNWKDRGYDTYVFAAPVSIDNRTAYIATVVKHDSTANRFYLHEIVDDTGNILYLAENKDGLDTFKTTSTIDASSGVSLPSINIVPNSVQKVNGANNYNVTQEGYLPKVGDAMPSVWDAKPMPTAGENVLPYIDTNRTDKSDSIVEQLRSNISNLSGMKAVKSLTGEEFLKSDKGLVEQVMDFIKDYITQNGPIKRAGFGEINITKRGVKSSLAHGIGREKAIAFAAIPEVLKSGKEIGFQRNWKNRNYDTHIFAAPVKIKNEVAYVAAVVTSSDNSNRYYLHEVVDSNGNIIEINKGDGAQNLDVSAGLKTRLIDTKVGNTSPNNIVPNSVQKVNTSKPLRIADYSDDSLVEAAKSFSPDEQKIITDYVTSELENPPDNKQMVMEREKGYTLSKRMYTDDEQAIIDKYKAKLSSQKDKYEKKISKTEGLYKDKIKASKEKQKTAKLGNEVLKVAKRIQKDFKHMPPDMKEKAYAALKNIDTKAKSISKKSIDNAYELKSYVEAMQALDPNFVVSKGIQDRIDRLSKNVRISNLTYNELLDLSDTLSGLVHEFKNYNKMLGTAQKQKVSDMSAAAQREVNSSKSQRNGFINKTFKVESLNPTTVFNVLGNFTKGGAMETIRDEFIKGQRKSIKYVKDATKLFDEFLNNKEYSGELETWGGKKAKWIDTGLSDGNGKIYMTPGERIDIYLHSLNSNNRATMMNGGYTFISKESLIKGDNENLYKGMKPVKLTSDDITRITSGMTAAEKEFADIAHKYFNSTSKTSINETSMVTNGYERADVDNYYPKSIDKDAIVTGFALDDEGGNINEPSYLQERNGNTGAPIKGRNAVEVVLNSINEVGKYYGFAIPMRDFTMVWNSRGNGTTTLKKAVADTFGNDMVAYINKFAKDINSSKTNRYYVDKLAGKLMRNYAASVLNFNPKVSLQQTASLITAAPEVGYESIVKALFGTPKELRRQIIREIDSRSGYRWDRAFRGNSTAELSMLTKNGGFKSQQNGKSQKFKDIANPTKWIRNMDLWATDEIAYAAYYNVVNEGKYKMGSSEFWNAVTDRYETTLENTQPMYNIMQRTGIARSDSTLAYAFNMFATQRNQNYNMAYNALGEYQSVKRSGGNKKKARAKFNKTMGALFMSTAVVTLMTTLAQYVTNRKKLEDENGDITLESFMKYYRSAFLSSAAGNVIGGSQIYNGLNSLIKGEAYYGTEEPTLDLVNDLVTSSIGLGKKLADYAIGFKESYEAGYLPEYMSKEKSEALKAVHDSVIAITKLFGIPMANAEKYTTGLVGTLFPEIETAYNSMYSGLTNATIKKASGRNQDAYIGMALKDRVSDNLDKNSISEIQSLYHATDGSSKVLPRYEAPDNISKEATQKRKNVDYDLTIADKVKFEDKYSDILEEELPELLNSSFYKGLTTEEQLYAIYYLYSYAEEQSKKAVVKEYAVSDNYNMKNIGISDYRSYIKDKEEKERKKKK